jgi:hypothetical protein
MDKYLRQLITIEFDDKKKFSVFYWLDWRLILIKNNPVDFIIDGYTILKTKCKGNYPRQGSWIYRKSHKTQRIKTSAAEIIPLKDISSIIYFLASKYEIFQIATKSDKAVYLGKLIEMMKEVVIDF